MKVGDLVQCTWQPRSSHIDENDCAAPMLHTIKGEMGLITEVLHSKYSPQSPRYQITFPQLGYMHPLSDSAFEVISESR
jgi:hypothetical protein